MKKISFYKLRTIVLCVVLLIQFFYKFDSLSAEHELNYLLDGEKVTTEWDIGVISDSIDHQKNLSITNISQKVVLCSILSDTKELQILPTDSFQLTPKQTIQITLQWNLTGRKIGRNREELIIKTEKEIIYIGYNYCFEPKNFSISVSMNELTFKINNKYFTHENGELDTLCCPNYIVDGRMYVSLQIFAQFLGFNPEGFNFSDSSMNFTRNGKKYYFKYLAEQILIDGEPMKTHKLHIIRNMRMSLPIRLMAELAGYTITWDPKELRATISHQH